MGQDTGTLGTRTVRRIGFGAMGLRGEQGKAVLRRAIELGVDHIDTAPFYDAGAVNELIRTALHPYPERLALATKVGAREHAGGLVTAQRPEELRADVEETLRALDVERVALVNLRRADAAPGIIAHGDQVVDLDSQLSELVALRDEGKVENIGLSNVTSAQVKQARPAGIACVQNCYNLLTRGDEALLLECSALGIAWVPFFPLGSAFAHLPKVADHPDVQAVARRLSVTPAQVGLAWLLHHDRHILLIPGTTSVDHLEQNMQAAHVDLEPAMLSTLDAIGR